MADEKKAPQCQYKSNLIGYTVYGTPIIKPVAISANCEVWSVFGPSIDQGREVQRVIGTRLDDAIRRR